MRLNASVLCRITQRPERIAYIVALQSLKDTPQALKTGNYRLMDYQQKKFLPLFWLFAGCAVMEILFRLNFGIYQGVIYDRLQAPFPPL